MAAGSIRRRLTAAAVAAATVWPGIAEAKPPLEAFGDHAAISFMTLSPDGSKVAFVARRGEVDQVMVQDLATKAQRPLATIGDFKSRGVAFAGDGYVILTASKTTRNTEWLTDKFEDSSAFAINLETGESVQLLTRTPSLWPAQGGLHQIVGHDPSGRHVFMPAYTFEGRVSADPPRDLLRVSLDTGVGLAAGGRSGSPSTRDWFLNGEGEVVAREDYNEKTGEYVIRVYDGDRPRVLHERTEALPTLSVMGLAAGGGALIVADRSSSQEFYTLYEMSLADGAMAGPILKRHDADIQSVLMNRGRVAVGVRYAGMYPDYDFFDPALDADIEGVQAKLPDASVTVASWSDDFSRVLLYIDGGAVSPRYALFDRTARTLDLVAVTRPEIRNEHLGEVMTIEYKASDGLTIPALVTWPAGLAGEGRKNLPTIVLPHGGPEAYDAVGFDWLAQFFANEGYLVLQPNFRGSGGFGESFARAGYNQWGRRMQSDVTEGADALAAMGWSDPARTCIAGASYGGYSALAGGALTPQRYRCVVSINGVADLRDMLATERREHGSESVAYRYWSMLIGDMDRDREAIDAVSPVKLADRFEAPVLLIHGSDDLVVPVRHSEEMEAALTRAGKPVEYLKLKGDDHGLSDGANRVAALTAIRDFVAAHINAAP
jgi:dipeptidyl aminopeptidase/acylaminoacyl peptidase